MNFVGISSKHSGSVRGVRTTSTTAIYKADDTFIDASEFFAKKEMAVIQNLICSLPVIFTSFNVELHLQE